MLQNEKDLWKVLEMKKYKWRIESGEISPKYNLSKYYQHGDLLWKLSNRSIESIGKITKIIVTNEKIIKYVNRLYLQITNNILF